MVTSGLLQHVRNQFCCDRCTTLVLFVLPSVREQWDDRSDSLRAGNLAGVDHNAKFHQGCIHGPASRIDDIHVVFSHGFCDANVCLANAAPRYLCTRDLYTEPGRRQPPRE